MIPRRPRRRPAAVAGVLLLALASGGAARAVHSSGATPDAPPGTVCANALTGRALTPPDGVLAGVSLDWAHDTVADYSRRLGWTPAVAVSFAALPLTPQARADVGAAVEQVRTAHGSLMLTVEPHGGLASVTPQVVADLVRSLAEWNDRGVPVFLRFAHEMNGSWYPWGQQPAEYVATYRRVARAVHAGAPTTAMVWAPNYGGGYPFAGGAHGARPGGADAGALDTDGDGRLTAQDDAYAPYYPGDDVVDWAGLSLYHWGASHPWGRNVAPERGKLAAMLTGTYEGTVGDERDVPDFHAVYGVEHRLPLALTETAAFYAPDAGGPAAEVKLPWIEQVFDRRLAERFPAVRMVNWFEWDKQEPEVGARVDWGVTRDPEVLRAYREAQPSWLRFAGGCGD